MQIEINEVKYELKFQHARWEFPRVIRTKPFGTKQYERAVVGHTMAKIFRYKGCPICHGDGKVHGAGGWDGEGRYMEGAATAEPCKYCKGRGYSRVLEGRGESWCSMLDEWSYEKGRKVALTRALDNASSFRPSLNNPFGGREARSAWWYEYHAGMSRGIARERDEAMGTVAN